MEYALYEYIAEALDTDVYFADPYASNQRGANENTNGLLGQYVSNGNDLRTITNKLMTKHQQRLNLRPEKTLGFIQPDITQSTIATNHDRVLQLLVESRVIFRRFY